MLETLMSKLAHVSSSDKPLRTSVERPENKGFNIQLAVLKWSQMRSCHIF